MKLKKGSSRLVFLVRGYAIKIPALYSYKGFLYGLLANMQEKMFWDCEWMREGLCPILFYIPAGIMVVMPECEVLLDIKDVPGQDLELFCDRGEYVIPAEHKIDSFGWLEGKLVAIDYG